MKFGQVPKDFQDPGPTLGQKVRVRMLTSSIFRSRWIRRKTKEIGDIAGHISFVQAQFNTLQSPTFSREKLWETIAEDLADDSWHGIEFGVAWGYCTAWWTLTRSPEELQRWDGFDLFTGLPEKWRNLQAGYFSNDGIPPKIDDPRVVWHVGDVSSTINELSSALQPNRRLFIIFDLDLYKPSLVCWDYIKSYLKPGDILYFDEAYDAEEYSLLVNEVLSFSDFELIGYSPFALAIKMRC